MLRVFLGVLLLMCGSLAFATGQVIKGIVYDELTNKPIPNLTIYADSVGTKVTVTNKKGEFTYPVKPGQRTIQILPYSKAIVGKSIFVNVAEFKDKVVKIVVERGMKLQVNIRDEHGHPIPGAYVNWFGAGGCAGPGNAKGTAVIGMVSRFREGGLRVTAPGYEEFVRTDIYAPHYADGGITVTLKPKPKAGTPAK